MTEIKHFQPSHPEKVYFPKKKITKQEVLQYYADAWPRMKKHLRNRPLSLERYPEGIAEAGFYQKNIPQHFPDRLERITVEKKEGQNTQTYVQSKADLLALVNQGTLCFHIWQSEKEDLEKATRLVIDLDPSREDLTTLKKTARQVAEKLSNQGLDPQVMCTGQSGLHVYAFLSQARDFDALRADVKKWCRQLTDKHPERYTLAQRKAQRGGKIFLDYLRNAYGQTSICPYSLRPTAHASLACPLDRSALSRLRAPDQYHLKNIRQRWAQKEG